MTDKKVFLIEVTSREVTDSGKYYRERVMEPVGASSIPDGTLPPTQSRFTETIYEKVEIREGSSSRIYYMRKDRDSHMTSALEGLITDIVDRREDKIKDHWYEVNHQIRKENEWYNRVIHKACGTLWGRILNVFYPAWEKPEEPNAKP